MKILLFCLLWKIAYCYYIENPYEDELSIVSLYKNNNNNFLLWNVLDEFNNIEWISVRNVFQSRNGR